MSGTDEQITITGEVELILRGPDGRVKSRTKKENLVVTVGKEAVCDQLLESPGVGKPKYIAIGTSGTAPAAGNTALGGELKRKEASRSRSGAVLTMSALFGAGEGTGNIQEAGVLTASSGGTLYSRTTFATEEKGALDSLEVTWKLTVS